jgi:hypothetical protein
MDTDIAGPSGSNDALNVTEVDLAAADRDFGTGLQALRVSPSFILLCYAQHCACEHWLRCVHVGKV